MELSEACQRLREGAPAMTLLNLSDQYMGNSGIRKLCRVCREVEASENAMGRKSESHTSTTTASGSSSSSSLIMIWMERNLITAAGCDAFDEFLRMQKSLNYLYLAHNSVGDRGVTILAPWCMEQIAVLNLSDNGITKVGAHHVAKQLQNPRSKTTALTLQSNPLGDEGAIEIAEGLQFNTTLESVDLRYTGISAKGLEALVATLRSHNKTLRWLYLDESEPGAARSDSCHCHVAHDHSSSASSSSSMSSASSSLDGSGRCKCRHIREEIDFLLAMNRAGRHAFGNTKLPVGLFPRIISKSMFDPAVQYSLLLGRPDILERKVST
mmetsp:Transcript_21411/g.61152  ORF Transcript_21411/g.61152 Transcript_21411/m.61152 type:complete len:325 (+) Transcript_21411:266-1240(+)